MCTRVYSAYLTTVHFVTYNTESTSLKHTYHCKMRSSNRSQRKNGNWGVSIPTAPYYEFRELLVADSNLKRFMNIDEFGTVSTDFSTREATLALTRATLKLYFSLTFTLPAGHLIPVIPGRVQYLRWATSLLPKCTENETISVLDIGCGPSAIYDLLGARLYPKWKFLGTDTDAQAVALARGLVISNGLKSRVKIKRTNPTASLLDTTIWEGSDAPQLTVCNPPFFESTEAELEEVETVEPAGTESQMGTKGGEVEFLKRMARDSVSVAHTGVFTSLIGLGADVEKVKEYLTSDEVRARNVVSVRLNAGKTNRWAVGWRFGPPKSKVSVFWTITKCEWKAPLWVIPSRVYANRMTVEEVLELWCKAMELKEWEKSTAQDDEQENESEPVKLGKRYREDDDDEIEEVSTASTCTQVMEKLMDNHKDVWKIRGKAMVSRADDYSFFIEMEVVDDRGVEVYSVFKVAQEVSECMRKLLDKEPQQLH